jgi:uncharacterized protein (TIGR02266 family)
MNAARLLSCAAAMDQPKEPRPPVNLRIKFRSASLDQFIERYAGDVSRGGIFIRTREPLAVGTELRLDFKLQEGQQLLTGEGTVVWVREPDPGRPQALPGMGVRFDELSVESRQTLDHILTEKAKREKQGPTPMRGAESGGMAVRRPSSSFSAIESQVPPKNDGKKDDAVPTASATPNTAPVDLTGPTTTASAINYRALVASSARPATLPPAGPATETAPKTLPEGATAAPAAPLGVPKPFIAGTPPTGQEKLELPSANEVDEAFAGMVNDSGPSRLGATPTPPAGQPALPRGTGASETYRAPAFRTGRRITGSVTIQPPEAAAPKNVDEPSSEPTLIADTPEALLAAAKKGKGVPSDDQPTPGPEMLAALDLFGRTGRADEAPSEPVLGEATAPGAIDKPAPGVTAAPPRLSLPASAFGNGAAPAEPTSLRDSEPPPTASGSFTNAKTATPETQGPKPAVIVEAQRGGSARRPGKSKAPLIGGLVAAGGAAALIVWQLGLLGGAPRSTSPTPPPAAAPPSSAAPPENVPGAGTVSPGAPPATAPAPAGTVPEGSAAAPTPAADDKGGNADKAKAANGIAHQLRVITTPTGAQIAIDGKPVGRSPYVDKTFDVSGMHTVTASKEGFETWEMSVSAEDEWQEVKTAKGSALAELVLKPKLKKNAVSAAPRPRPRPAAKPNNASPTEAPAGTSLEPPKLDAERAVETPPPKEDKAEKPAEKTERADKPEKASDKVPKAGGDKPEKTGEKDAPLPPN